MPIGGFESLQDHAALHLLQAVRPLLQAARPSLQAIRWRSLTASHVARSEATPKGRLAYRIAGGNVKVLGVNFRLCGENRRFDHNVTEFTYVPGPEVRF